MSSPAFFDLAEDEFQARVAAHGAELVRLRHRGVDLLWRPDPRWWDRTAPILFPVVGRSPEGRVRVDGRPYPMPPHGFARDRDFEAVEITADRLRLRLSNDAETSVHYPFAFRLDMTFAILDGGFACVAEIANTSDAPLPYGFGFHPAFARIPAAGPVVCRFERDEPAPIRRHDMETGLLLPQDFPSPIVDRAFEARDAHFVAGAIVWDRLASRRMTVERPGHPKLRLAHDDCPQLGVWTKPGAPFLCVEPWHGLAERVGADGELFDRPGTVVLPPGARRAHTLTIACPS
jgi:galactose mutarotase-like enzyme